MNRINTEELGIALWLSGKELTVSSAYTIEPGIEHDVVKNAVNHSINIEEWYQEFIAKEGYEDTKKRRIYFIRNAY